MWEELVLLGAYQISGGIWQILFLTLVQKVSYFALIGIFPGGSAMEHVGDKFTNARAQITEREGRFFSYLIHRWSAFKSACVAGYCRIVDALY